MLNLNHSLAMGIYGLYVWPAYAITLSVFLLNAILSIRQKRQAKKMVKHYLSTSGTQPNYE
jgi:heme exporter protein CcmD